MPRHYVEAKLASYVGCPGIQDEGWYAVVFLWQIPTHTAKRHHRHRPYSRAVDKDRTHQYHHEKVNNLLCQAEVDWMSMSMMTL
jgi:hypothetical protein